VPLSSGEKLGPYEIVAPLGAGGMGEVYKARDTRFDRLVAVKVSKTAFDQRFKREARAVAALNHPNICALYDVGPNYLVMEYVEGTELKGPLPAEKAVELGCQILDALDAAHRKGITHRDLKPANVMVTKSGVKVLDFGLAKMAQPSPSHEEATRTILTQENSILGTLHYMAPEQLQGRADVDARADIFAFGCVLYEVLTGKRAFEGASAASVIAAILEREPEPLNATPPLDRVIRTCLAKEPDRRFQSALDLKRNLLWAMEETAPAATRTRKAWIAATAVLALALGSATTYLATRPAPPPEARLDIVTPPTTAPGQFALSPDGQQIA
jgi:serine/threonine protein kinase